MYVSYGNIFMHISRCYELINLFLFESYCPSFNTNNIFLSFS